MKVVNKGIEIERDNRGRITVKERLDIEFDDKEEAERTSSLLEARMEESIRQLQEAAKRDRR